MKPRVLICAGSYVPGFDSSGPNLSLRAMCEALRDDFDFSIAARDRPLGAAASTVEAGRWHDLGYARSIHLPARRIGVSGLGKLLAETPHDVLDLNGFFDRDFTIPALVHRRWAGRSGGVLLSPRGEFSGGALALKSPQKRAYLFAARALGLLRGVTLHATSDAEFADIREALPDSDVRLVTNLRPMFDLPDHAPRPPGTPLRVAFLGRISPVKGLDVALRALARVVRPVRFEIYGPAQDMAHWEGCQRLIAALPGHIEAVAMGEIANADAALAMARQDVLLLPSRSENFGHSIFEALAAGTPVVIGQKTPWRDLAAVQAGWDVPLDDVDAVAAAIDRFAIMPDAELAAWRTGARRRAEAHVAGSDALPKMRELFNELAGKKAKR
ncbi:glycosyltransferase family 4 protein [Sphingomonas donggukensis]|uniref:Glycosyltransferase family 4 protein n=1 Tax=Sphingomonas donggukensis TaxID=2949093 RepID=A0ABY4TTC4_9SPHN|nr:glycosyltransferase family 4 protein [Sphingomonas donggukensis]URW74449.1 glycosyltransferase family 4 protein [Sphingomonas donggukensis]